MSSDPTSYRPRFFSSVAGTQLPVPLKVETSVAELRARALACGVTDARFAELVGCAEALAKGSRHGTFLTFLRKIVDADIGN